MPRPQKPFQVLRRAAKGSKVIYYIAFRLPDGTMTTPKSSGQTSKGAAERWAIQQIQEDKLPKPTTEDKRDDLIPFLVDFWDYDNSKYVRGKLARGGTISRNHCKIMGYMVGKYVKPTFDGRSIPSLTSEDFEDWMDDLASQEVPARQINSARQSINVGLNYLTEQRRLPWNPLTAVKPYKEVNEKRGVPSVDEFRKLLEHGGLDPRVHLAIAFGGLCGLRMGEVRGLRWEDVDIERKRVDIHTSFVEVDGEREQAKHGSNRVVPVPQVVLDALNDWKTMAKATGPHDWIFWDERHPDVPMFGDDIRDGYYIGLEGIGIFDRKERRIVFHSLRHWYNTQLRGAIPEATLRRFTGHQSEEMTDLYDAGREHEDELARSRMDELVGRTATKAD